MLRITEQLKNNNQVVLILEGKIAGDSVIKLLNYCLNKIDDRKLLVLDFRGITFIDKNGIAMLEEIKDERVQITNCSLFVKKLLEDLIE